MTRRALQRAIDALGAQRVLDPAYQDIAARLPPAVDRTISASAGLVRTIDHYLSAEVHADAPDWRRVRALHRAWVAARAHDLAVRTVHDAAASKRSE